MCKNLQQCVVSVGIRWMAVLRRQHSPDLCQLMSEMMDGLDLHGILIKVSIPDTSYHSMIAGGSVRTSRTPAQVI